MGVTFPQGDPRRKLPAYEAATRRGIRDAVLESCLTTQGLSKQALTDVSAVDQGILRGSVDFAVTAPGASLVVGVVRDGTEYGRWIEFGRAGIQSDPSVKPGGGKPSFPPVAALIGWVRRHFRQLAPSGRTKSGKARRATPADAARVAFLIARKIWLHGTKPRPWLVPSFRQVARTFPERAAHFVTIALSRVR